MHPDPVVMTLPAAAMDQHPYNTDRAAVASAVATSSSFLQEETLYPPWTARVTQFEIQPAATNTATTITTSSHDRDENLIYFAPNHAVAAAAEHNDDSAPALLTQLPRREAPTATIRTLTSTITNVYLIPSDSAVGDEFEPVLIAGYAFQALNAGADLDGNTSLLSSLITSTHLSNIQPTGSVAAPVAAAEVAVGAALPQTYTTTVQSKHFHYVANMAAVVANTALTPQKDSINGDAAGATATAATTNAISILQEALPSGVAASIQSALNSLTGSATGTATGDITGAATSTGDVQPTNPPMSGPGQSQTGPPGGPSSRPHHPGPEESAASTTHHMMIPPTMTTFTSATRTSTSSSQTTSAITSNSSTLVGASSSTANATAAPPATSDAKLPNNAIAGVATGVTAGAVLFLLAVVYFLRRRQQQQSGSNKPFFSFLPFLGGRKRRGAASEKAAVYPEVAWIYDPTRTPPNGASRPGDALLGGAAGGAAGDAAAHQAARDQQDSRAALLPGSSGTLNSSASAIHGGGADPAAAALMHDTDHHDHHPATTERDLTDASPRLRPISVSSPLYVPGAVTATGAAAALSTPPTSSKGKDRAFTGARSPPSSGSGSASGSASPRLTEQQQRQQHRDSWAKNRDAWTSSPLLAGNDRAASPNSFGSRSPDLGLMAGGGIGMAVSGGTTSANGSRVSLGAEERRPLTAIYEERLGQ